MGISSRVIRLFVSSTFADFQSERDILQERVFPQLRKLCSGHGVEFQAVDLRWGIRAEEALEQQTLAICLKEVERCLALSPMPNFLILLGERYGWQPLPASIPEEEFSEIVKWIVLQQINASPVSSEQAIQLLVRWYQRDANAHPPHFRLQPRELESSHSEWLSTEENLRQILRKAVTGLGWQGIKANRYLLSATHQEILQGVLSVSSAMTDVRDHVFCFQRRRLSLTPNTPLPPSGSFIDLDENGNQDIDASVRLAELTERLKHRLGNNFLTYQAFAKEREDISRHHLEVFAHDAYEVLAAIIRPELDRLLNINELAREQERHQSFCTQKALLFTGHSEIINRVLAKRAVSKTQVIYGEGGIGKSSVIAKTLHMAESLDWNTSYRFIGLTSATSSGLGLLRSLCEEISQSLGTPIQWREDTLGWSDEFKRLVILLDAQSNGQYLLAIDALDQLPEGDPARSLAWIPREAPKKIRILLSCTSGEMLDALHQHLLDAQYTELRPLGNADASRLLKEWLLSYKRQLQPKQFAYVLSRYADCGLPLYLRLASEEARHWTSYDQAPDQAGILASGVESLIQQLFERLASPQYHGRAMVKKSLGYLVAARHGLTESELVGVLSSDEDVMNEFRSHAPQGKQLDQLPFIVWSRLRDDLDPYLSERQANGLPAIGFFHRIFGEVAASSSLSNSDERRYFHKALSNYFSRGEHSHNYFIEGTNNLPNRRRLSELPFHLLHAGEIERLLNLLCDEEYFSAKLETGERYELFSEYLQCHTLLKENQKKTLTTQKLARKLASHILRHASGSNPHLDIEDIHAFLAFRKDTSLYRIILAEAIQKSQSPEVAHEPNLKRLHLGMRARQGNLLRRDGHLTRAKKLLAEIRPLVEANGASPELARIEYDLGYIAYLQGDLRTSIPLITQSAETARSSNNQVGEWISRCVAGHQQWLLDLLVCPMEIARHKFENLLEEALVIFERRKHDDTTSERWVMNVHAHRFYLAYRHGDHRMASDVIRTLETDPWLKGFGDELSVKRYQARLEILEGNHVSGAEQLASIARDRLARSAKEEALAEDYFDAYQGYIFAGEKDLARVIRQEGLALRSSYGNGYWQERLRLKNELQDD